MKKLTVFAICLLAVLTGCGSVDNRDNASSSPVSEITTQAQTETDTETDVQEITETTAALETSAETSAAETVTTTVYIAVPKETTVPETAAPVETQPPVVEIETQAVRQPDTVKPDRETVIEGYKKIIRTRIEKVMSEGNPVPLVSYALYDMDYDGTPELLVKYGSCEADFRIAIFKYQSDGMITLADDLPGSHTSFGYDYVANQIVLITGFMGYGNMSWYDIDGNGQLRFLIDTGEFEYANAEGEDFASIMKRFNVAYLDFSEFFGSDTTWVYIRSGGQDTMLEYGGYDFSYLENYSF